MTAYKKAEQTLYDAIAKEVVDEMEKSVLLAPYGQCSDEESNLSTVCRTSSEGTGWFV